MRSYLRWSILHMPELAAHARYDFMQVLGNKAMSISGSET
ncbi:hypothetical protein APHNP_0616 [Anaplasma phagocytophilum str. ApNP]|uniref:Uncharacterized protein n=1 Tax=Anaplasma phagocytophilum str. ApNP TaxID=1359153 RepID=A0A0F3NF11_ANAPH|nr:hypothetical protein APHNP_0616 [Anaplasma phagocytophilum str. ApNP]